MKRKPTRFRSLWLVVAAVCLLVVAVVYWRTAAQSRVRGGDDGQAMGDSPQSEKVPQIALKPPAFLLPVRVDGRWGVINGSGDVVVPPEYDQIELRTPTTVDKNLTYKGRAVAYTLASRPDRYTGEQVAHSDDCTYCEALRRPRPVWTNSPPSPTGPPRPIVRFDRSPERLTQLVIASRNEAGADGPVRTQTLFLADGTQAMQFVDAVDRHVEIGGFNQSVPETLVAMTAERTVHQTPDRLVVLTRGWELWPDGMWSCWQGEGTDRSHLLNLMDAEDRIAIAGVTWIHRLTDTLIWTEDARGTYRVVDSTGKGVAPASVGPQGSSLYIDPQGGEWIATGDRREVLLSRRTADETVRIATDSVFFEGSAVEIMGPFPEPGAWPLGVAYRRFHHLLQEQHSALAASVAMTEQYVYYANSGTWKDDEISDPSGIAIVKRGHKGRDAALLGDFGQSSWGGPGFARIEGATLIPEHNLLLTNGRYRSGGASTTEAFVGDRLLSLPHATSIRVQDSELIVDTADGQTIRYTFDEYRKPLERSRSVSLPVPSSPPSALSTWAAALKPLILERSPDGDGYQIVRDDGETILAGIAHIQYAAPSKSPLIIYSDLEKQQRLFHLERRDHLPLLPSKVEIITDQVFRVELADGRYGYLRSDFGWLWPPQQ